MRSSIACVRCRRSKIKCVNQGTDTRCRACEINHRECTYPIPAPGQSSMPKRPAEVPSGIKNEGETEAKRVRKKDTESSRKHSLRHGEDPLEYPAITPKMWTDVYRMFMLHCSTELPFLHEDTFRGRVAQHPASRSPDTKVFLLAMLAVTARHVPEMLASHDTSDPLAVSEFYAEACAERLGANVMTRDATLERMQALLMLSFYHWGMWRGSQSLLYLTISYGMAQVLRLRYDPETENSNKSKTSPLLEDARDAVKRTSETYNVPQNDTQLCIDSEIRRRTAYSMFILDRYLTSGQHRDQIFNIDKFYVRLPCSDEDFQFGSDVKTGTLAANMAALSGPIGDPDFTPIDSAEILSRYVLLVEIWGQCSAWSCHGGRRQEKSAPWQAESRFFQLRSLLESFQTSLPTKLTFSPINIKAHLARDSVSLFLSMHTLLLLATIVLHREYVPFAPFSCKGPTGPIDEPVFANEDVPPGFFEESAGLFFKAARDILKIVREAADRGVLVESPTVAFALWNATHVSLYADHFPQMDIVSQSEPKLKTDSVHDKSHWSANTSLAAKLLKQMRPKMKMASYWYKYMEIMDRKYIFLRNDYEYSVAGEMRNPEYDRLSGSQRKTNFRDGGLAEYKLVEKELTDFGPSPGEDRGNTPALSESHESNVSRGSTHGLPAKNETISGASRNSVEGAWAAVNTSMAANGNGHGHVNGNSNSNGSEEYSTRAYPASNAGTHNSTYYNRNGPINTIISSTAGPYGRPDAPHGYQASNGNSDAYKDSSTAVSGQASSTAFFQRAASGAPDFENAQMIAAFSGQEDLGGASGVGWVDDFSYTGLMGFPGTGYVAQGSNGGFAHSHQEGWGANDY